MKRKIYEFNYDQSSNGYVFVYKTETGKWQKQKCQSNHGKIGIPLFSVKKDNLDRWIKNQIKCVNEALDGHYHYNEIQGIFVIKQKSQFENEMKVTVFGAPGFGDKLFRNS
jgi:hypothetical protein